MSARKRKMNAVFLIHFLSGFEIQICDRNLGGTLLRKNRERFADDRIILNFHLMTVTKDQNRGRKCSFFKGWGFGCGLAGVTQLFLVP